MLGRQFNLLVINTLFLLCTLGLTLNSHADDKQWDILVVAPHPDDETLGAAGVIMQALQAGQKVGVVVLTNGDGYPLAASTVTGTVIDKLTPKDFMALASARQQYVEKSLSLIDFSKHNLHFLGYPDGGLESIYHGDQASPYLNSFTQRSNTYSAHTPDYHSVTFGQPGSYIKNALLQDLAHIIGLKKPTSIYVTSAKDGHSDHQAAFHFTHDAALISGYQGQLNTYLIHSGSEHGDWPYPYTQDHKQSFQSHINNGKQIPEGLDWPPQLRVALSPKQAAKKLDMINQFDAEILTAADYMRAFVKSEEIFWPVTIQQN